MDSSRTFIAIELGASAAATVERLIHELQQQVDGVRWSRREQLHLTLKFIGDLDHRQLPALCGQLRVACAEVEPFAVLLQGLGTFPKDRPPRVVWAKVQQGADSLQQLSRQLTTALQDFGLRRETRAYTPHLTLGRVGRTADTQQLQHALARLANTSVRFDVNEIVLFATRKERGSVYYEPLDIVEL